MIALIKAAFLGLGSIVDLVNIGKDLVAVLQRKHKFDLMRLASEAKVDYKKAETDEEVWDALEKIHKVQQG